MHKLPPLPFAKDALVPVISAETIDFHYGKHHQAYVDNLNKLTAGTDLADAPLEQVVRSSQGGVFNNAAQVWNHSFYWNCLKPGASRAPGGALGEAIAKSFGSFDNFKAQFTQAAVTLFGSGWAWLVRKPDGSLGIVQTSNAATPLTGPDAPLLTCDVWEHAYYIDYRNARAKYVETFFGIANWDFAAQNFAR